MITYNYIAAFFLIVLGFYTIVTKYNLVKTAPIFTAGELTQASYFVDPIPQALTLTSIVIGACVTAMSLSLVVKLHEDYGTIDTREIRRLRG